MTFETERRGALGLLGLSLAVPFAGAAHAAPAASGAKPGASISFETWLRLNNLAQIYADCADRADLDGLVQVFTPDALYEYGPEASSRGREAIHKFLSARIVRYARMITIIGTPAEITSGATPGTYSAWVSFMARHEWKNGNQHTVYGRYVDDYATDAASGQLLIARRRIVAQCVEGEAANRYWLERKL